MKIGIDIGGSHIAIGLIDNNGNILTKKEIEITDKEKINSKNFLVESIIKYIKEILLEKNFSEKDIELIGIASPGTIKNNVILKSTNLKIRDFDIISELKKYFNTEYIIRNDAKCSTLAEKYYGSMKNYSDFVYICLGTGIGSGVVINNKILQPKRYEGFELGHIVIEKEGKLCSCGKKGCWEQYASMRVLKNTLIEKMELDGNTNSYEILDLLNENKENKDILEIIENYLNYLALGIENIINIFEPEVICIGGSFVYYKEILLEKLKAKLKEKNAIFNDESIPEIICAQLENDAGILGATIL